MKNLTYIILTAMMLSCTNDKTFDLQGHRGARGAMPENTVPAFVYAIEHGVTTLELDLAVTRNRQLLVSHEPYMSAEICLDSMGREISDSAQLSYNIYQMSYNEIRQFDCGLKAHPRFPAQKKMPAQKPLLIEVIDTVARYLQRNELPDIHYNIEIKSQPAGDDIYHPAPSEFSELVYEFINANLGWERVTIQSFDMRVLQYFHQKHPNVKLALLIENKLSFKENLDSLGFIPDLYSPYYGLLTKRVVDDLHQEGIKVIPWTVNDPVEMESLVQMGVDGLITDHPSRFVERLE